MGDVSTIHQTFVVFSSCCLPYCIHTCIYTPFLISNVCYSVLVLCLEFRSYFEICLFSDPNMHKVCLTFKAVLTVNKELFPANLCTEVQTLRNNYPHCLHNQATGLLHSTWKNSNIALNLVQATLCLYCFTFIQLPLTLHLLHTFQLWTLI